jgi:type IV pilus assembly protein PilE
MMRKRLAGFTLIELVIAMVIIAILATIAYPTYLEQLRKTRRNVGKNDLLEIAAREEKFFSDNSRFTVTLAPDAVELDLNFRDKTLDNNYTLNVVLVPPLGYLATATARPDGPQALDNPCTTLTLNHLGQKSPVINCW